MCFTYRIDKNPAFYLDLKSITDQAEKGHIVLVTSVFTTAEVAKIGLDPKAPIAHEEQERLIEEFFENDFIYLVATTPSICKRARQLVREFSLKGKDAIHVATALEITGIPVMHTYDKDILKVNGHIMGTSLIIERPDEYLKRGLFANAPTDES